MATATRKKKRSRPVDDEDVAPRRSKGGSKGAVKLDLRKTERGKKGGYRYPEGEYKIKIDKAERKESQSGNTQIVMHCVIVEPEKYEGKPLIDRVTLTEKAMFRVGWLLDACNIKWKNAVVNFPLSKLEGNIIGVQLYDDEYSGKVSSKVAEYYTEEEIDDFLEEDDDDEDDEEEDDLDEDEEDEDDNEDDEDEEDEYDDLNTVKLKKELKKRKIKIKAKWDDDDMRDALREDDDDEDEDLDELDDDDL